MKYKIERANQDGLQSDNTRIYVKTKPEPIPLSREQQQNLRVYGSLHRPDNRTYLSQGKKKTETEQKISDKKLAEQEYRENKEKEAENLEHALAVLPYVNPWTGPAMWTGVGVDLITRGTSKGKYRSWGDMVDKNTGSGEFVGDLTNPGYYAGAFPKLVGKGLQSTSKYALQKAEPYLMGDKRIPMMIGYKPKQEFWNPFKKGNKFTPNSESYYRVIGDEAGYNDLINSGVVRPNQSGIFAGRNTYYTKGAINDINNPVIGGGVKKGTAYKGDYIVEINKNDIHFPTQEHGLNKDWNFGITKAGNEIPYSSEHLNVYKRSGNNYIKLDKKEMPFQSEINWGNWNKEIPSNRPLMNEYLQIEKTTKQNGTWMKNPDGSIFSGTPEQFVQQNSENFKKAFPKGHSITYRGDRTHHPELDYNPVFTGDKSMATYYGVDNGSYWGPHHKPLSKASIVDKNSGGLHELYYNSNRSKVSIDAKGQDFVGKLVDKKTGRIYDSTDDVQRSIAASENDAIITNIYDGGPYKGTVRIINHNYGSNNFMKSARGNNGMFDMSNPNIYKGLIPAAGLYGLTQSKKQGGTIHIKEKNKGKFTATKERTGKSTEELTHSKNPLTKKRAIFAQNASHWKHKEGGIIKYNISQILSLWKK